MKFLAILVIMFSLTGCLGEGTGGGTTIVNNPPPANKLVPDTSSIADGSVLSYVSGVIKWVAPSVNAGNKIEPKQWRLLTPADSVVGTLGINKSAQGGYITPDNVYVSLSMNSLKLNSIEDWFGYRYYSSSNCSDPESDLYVQDSPNAENELFSSNRDHSLVYIIQNDKVIFNYNSKGFIDGSNCVAGSGTIPAAHAVKTSGLGYDGTTIFSLKFQ